MKKKIATYLVAILACTMLFAQSPNEFGHGKKHHKHEPPKIEEMVSNLSAIQKKVKSANCLMPKAIKPIPYSLSLSVRHNLNLKSTRKCTAPVSKSTMSSPRNNSRSFASVWKPTARSMSENTKRIPLRSSFYFWDYSFSFLQFSWSARCDIGHYFYVLVSIACIATVVYLTPTIRTISTELLTVFPMAKVWMKFDH